MFVFPTLREEGNQNSPVAGADLVVGGNLFFQFKMPEFLRTRNAVEIQDGDLDRDFAPFYRFYIKNSPNSCQFNLLQKAASKSKNIVKYVSPLFHRDKNDSDQDAFYNFFSMPPARAMNHVCTVDFSQFVNPNRVQPQDDTHKICYSLSSVNNGEAYIFSQPEAVVVSKGLPEFNGDTLSLRDIPDDFVSLSEAVSYVTQLFDLASETNIEREDILSQIGAVQRGLIVQHDIFWVPIIRSISKRRVSILQTLFTK